MSNKIELIEEKNKIIENYVGYKIYKSQRKYKCWEEKGK